MKTTWKYPVTVGEFALSLPVGARFLAVQIQHAEPVAWFEVDEKARREERTFAVFGTGHPIREASTYLGTIQLFDGKFVGHLYETKRKIGGA